jgi:hypothetical protein
VDIPGHDHAVELAWDYFRQLYEGLYDHRDDSAGRRRYLTTRQPTAADHLAELAPLRTWENCSAQRGWSSSPASA